MADLDLTADEEYLRSTYTRCAPSRYVVMAYEFRYLFPGVIFAYFSWQTEDQRFLWVGFAWLLGATILRNITTRWANAFAGLTQKYEAKIAELEGQLESQ